MSADLQLLRFFLFTFMIIFIFHWVTTKNSTFKSNVVLVDNDDGNYDDNDS